MAQNEHEYTEEFISDAVGMTVVQGITQSQVTRELRIGANMAGPLASGAKRFIAAS